MSSSSGTTNGAGEGENGVQVNNSQPNQEVETSSGEPPCWSELPSLIIQKIYSYCSGRNQLSMSQVCRNWTREFNEPFVWLSRTLKFDITAPATHIERILTIAEEYAELIRHVEIIYSQCPSDITQSSAALLLKFIDILKDHSPLESIILRDSSRIIRYKHNLGFSTPEVVLAIRALLQAKNVETARFHDLKLKTYPAALLMLKDLTARAECRLRHLTLRNFLDRTSERGPIGDVLNLEILVAFINLETFQSTYSPIFEKIINDISERLNEVRSHTKNKEGNLERIKLECPDSLPCPPYKGISEQAWAHLKTLCPQLAVELELLINSLSPMETLLAVKKEMPLTSLSFIRRRPGMNVPRHVSIILGGLKAVFVHECLKELSITWMDVYQDLAKELEQFLLVCSKLETLRINVRHPVYELERLITVWLKNENLHLRVCNIHIEYIRTEEQESVYRALEERHAPDLKRIGVELSVTTEINQGDP